MVITEGWGKSGGDLYLPKSCDRVEAGERSADQPCKTSVKPDGKVACLRLTRSGSKIRSCQSSKLSKQYEGVSQLVRAIF